MALHNAMAAQVLKATRATGKVVKAFADIGCGSGAIMAMVRTKPPFDRAEHAYCSDRSDGQLYIARQVSNSASSQVATHHILPATSPR